MDTSDYNTNSVVSDDGQTKETKPIKQKWSLKKKIIVIVGSILAFIAVILLIANIATSAPLRVSDEFVANIQDKKATAAYNLLSTDAQGTITLNDFTSMVDQIGPILNGKPNMKSKEVSAETGRDSTAKVVYEISGSDDYKYDLTVNLVEKDGAWKVLNFESKKQ